MSMPAEQSNTQAADDYVAMRRHDGGEIGYSTWSCRRCQSR
jgi:hypothetical protein